jgi:hypothetical protein
MEIGKNFMCAISKKHLLKDTKILHCGSFVCSECLKELLEKNDVLLLCPCCDKYQARSVISSSRSDIDIDNLIKMNCVDISKELVVNLKLKVNSLEGKTSN